MAAVPVDGPQRGAIQPDHLVKPGHASFASAPAKGSIDLGAKARRRRCSHIVGMRWLLYALMLVLVSASPVHAAEQEALWALLRQGGQIVLIRHAQTIPGIGDPPGFRLDDCASQRNLSKEGRREAEALGQAFRARQIPLGSILSSRWCRCLDTARLAFGRADPWPMLDSIFGDPDDAAERTAAVRDLASRRPEGGNLILVTHQVNIAAVTGVSPAAGEMVILTPQGEKGFTLAGRLIP